MNISRNFMLIGATYLLIGVLMGSYMGGSGDHTLAPVHAHINLLGFTLMTVFGIVYRIIPAMAETGLARAHFWLHQAGALILLVGLFLMIGGFLPETTVGPALPVAEVLVILGVATFGYNLLKNGQ